MNLQKSLIAPQRSFLAILKLGSGTDPKVALPAQNPPKAGRALGWLWVATGKRSTTTSYMFPEMKKRGTRSMIHTFHASS
jgi:hypothetical protein